MRLLKESVKVHRQALKEQTHEGTSIEWASSQNNLGNALRTIGERDSIQICWADEAVSAYRAALTERVRERRTLQRAKSAMNLAYALVARKGDCSVHKEAESLIGAALLVYRLQAKATIGNEIVEAEKALRDIRAVVDERFKESSEQRRNPF